MIDSPGTATQYPIVDAGYFGSVSAEPSIPFYVEYDQTALRNDVAELRAEVAKLQRDLLSRPRQVLIATLEHDKATLRLPLPVEIQKDDDGATTVASSLDFELYATGEDEAEAIAALRRVIVEEMEFLRANETKLGPHLVSKLRRLRELVEFRE